MYKAVVDRIVDGKKAVLLVGEKETERIVPLEQLPKGTKEGSWIHIDENGKFTLDTSAANRMKQRIEQKKAQLLQKKSKSLFRK